MVSRSVPTKRKQTADMAESPPKRVTRARAAKTHEELEVNAKALKSTTAPVKAAASKRKAAPGPAAVPSKATKRKAGETNAAEEHLVEDEAADREKLVPTRTRHRKATKDETAVSTAGVPKSRGRQPKAIAEKPKADAATRGRLRKATPTESEELKPDPVPLEDEQKKPEPVKKNTRVRAGGPTASKSATAAVAAKATKPKKKVQFEDDQDKENFPLQVAESQKVGMKSTGTKAKPVRKPPVPRRSKKAPGGGSSKHELDKREKVPLSPKKVNQMAKTPSISDDELLGEKAPIKTPAQSPVRAQVSPSKIIYSVKKSAPGKVVAPSSPSKQISPTALGSPARRPPQSPFKDGMKISPKKFDLGCSAPRPIFSTSQNLSPVKSSLLQESAKRANLPVHNISSNLPSTQTPLKTSLLQSPARRPLTSPSKTAPSASIQESATEPVNLQASPRKVPLFSSSNMVSSELCAAMSPGGPTKMNGNQGRGAQDGYEAMNDNSEAEDIASPEKGHPFGDTAMYQSDCQGTRSTILTNATVPAISLAPTILRRLSVDSQLSEDELASPDKKYAPTPLRKPEFSSLKRDTPTQASNGASLTPLANQLLGWAASSPKEQRPSRQQRGIFSLGGLPTQEAFEPMNVDSVEETPLKTSLFEDEMAVIDADNHVPTPERNDQTEDINALQSSMESQASQEYGDENALPTVAEMLRAEQEANDPTLTCTPAKIFTPAKQMSQRPQEVCTVSKVPLRPAAEDSPIKVPRQRSKSVGGALSVLAESTNSPKVTIEQPATPQLTATEPPQVPSSGLKLDADTPGRNVRKSAASSVLKGAVVHVDVHTSEGADASGIFVDLLTQMGARCVKQWNWNPRVSLGASFNNPASPGDTSPNGTNPASKIGITHVVHKDGGKRTLEKVRLSDGVVMCVGVGWVLEYVCCLCPVLSLD